MSAPLLATKFYRPAPRPDLVPRPRLIERLEAGLYQAEGFARKLTLVCAPAGYGKTTLVAAWLDPGGRGGSGIAREHGSAPAERAPPHRVAWLSLDEGDNDPVSFLAYLVAALHGADENIGAAAQSLLGNPQPPGAELVLTTLLNDLAAGIPAPILLALDDYHAIHTPAIHRQLTFLLDHLPPQLHLAVLTREDPLLPVARLRARGQALEIRQDDLRFSAAETAEFLERVMGLPLSAAEIAALERRTEGWIAGLQLAALSMQGRQDLPAFIQAFTGSSRFILDYLIEEVFERQSAEVKDFLIETSILERLCGPLCDAVTEQANGQALLEALEQANLFIVPLDQSRVWYRYHRLFAELLRNRLRAGHPQLASELHQRASRWFEAEGLAAEAIRHALAAQDWSRAGSLILSANSELLKRGEVLTVIGWFQSLPLEFLRADPRLCFEYCWPLLLAGQYDVAEPLLGSLEQAAQGNPAFLGEIFAAQAYLARGTGDHARMVARSQQALGLLPASSRDIRGIVALNLGLAYWHMGRMDDTEEVLAEALPAAQATGNQYAALTAVIFQGRVRAVRGQLRQAEPYFQRAIQQGGEMPINALAHMDLTTLYYEWDALEESEAHIQKAIAICQRAQNDEFLVGCWLLQSRLRIAQGDLAGAEAALEGAWALVRDGTIPAPMDERLAAAQARLLLAKGKPLGEWAQKLSDQVDCHPFYRYLGVTKALALPDAQARDYLDGLSRRAQAHQWVYGWVAIRALQAARAENQGNALAYLSEALEVAADGGYLRTFVEAGERLIPHLRFAEANGVSPAYAERILAALRGESGLPGGLPDRLAAMIEPLSERELEVLRLVAAGKSNREIARQLYITTGTVKTHVHNLCGKLGASNRTQAAMRANELELL